LAQDSCANTNFLIIKVRGQRPLLPHAGAGMYDGYWPWNHLEMILYLSVFFRGFRGQYHVESGRQHLSIAAMTTVI
jgi:hypothetical protein